LITEIKDCLEIATLNSILEHHENFQLLATVILHEVKTEEIITKKTAAPGLKHFTMKIAVDSFPKTYRNIKWPVDSKIDKLTKTSEIEDFNPFVKSFSEIPHVHIMLNNLIFFKKSETEFIGYRLHDEFIQQNFKYMNFSTLNRIALFDCGTVNLDQVKFLFQFIHIIL